MKRRSALLGLGAWAASFGARAAEAWPTRPVHLIVPSGPGSSLDLIARALAQRLAARWGQPVVVDDKPGAGGVLGVDAAAKARDGHSFVLGFNGPLAFAPFLYRRLPYDPARDLVTIVMTTSQPNVLAVNAERVPARTVAEFVAWARTRRDGIAYSSLGNGSSAHLTMELFLHEARLAGVHVPYNGSPPAALAVAQGEADASFMVAPALLPHARARRVRLLAVTGAERLHSLPELPTMAEAGYPAVQSLAWNGLLAPAGTPEALIARINADVNAVLHEPAVRQALDAQGLAPVGGSAADFRRTIDADIKRWGPVITRLGVRLD
ncbi:Bug family tripartite tricarboxylate transporter substrate binding protein [Rubrivivax gelatinosus]|uniref:Bug family tripartite tricarboxylate transporter substrate binding protein n=1 Tax=Rubrivivax gelatinosus TaxID=28068 RepID=UPI00031F0BD1|nr:tripartite tricarboxylate transporter substrate-binding protein [Rubrivivax gelatinosus]MBG6080051.1 tripartite-type tricarboxylate transporter receptor subunit TctC [Rubrivivax gelatinosus]